MRGPRPIICAALCLLLAGGGAARQKSGRSAAAGVPTVAFCDLVNNPELYDGKVVRVRAFYRVGFEWSQMYCAECVDGETSTWVEFEDEMCRGSKEPKDDRTSSVVFVGKFYGSGRGYGHLNAYRFRFVVSCVEKSKTVLKSSPHPLSLRERDPESFNRMRCEAGAPRPQARGAGH